MKKKQTENQARPARGAPIRVTVCESESPIDLFAWWERTIEILLAKRGFVMERDSGTKADVLLISPTEEA